MIRAGALLVLLALPLAAQTVDRSLRPMPNPARVTAAVAPAPDAWLRPQPRPAGLGTAAPEKPAKPEKTARKKASAKGSVCGVAAIKGAPIAPIKGTVKGCGLAEGVRVTSVSGVQLSEPATIDCTTAVALNTWVKDVAQPAFGGKLVELRVAAHYICRSRNNIRGAKISEHGKGRAIDISAFVLKGGKVQSVAGAWGKTMRRAHKGACGLFSTTLGPGSDGYHEDNLHYDTARGRGPYCR